MKNAHRASRTLRSLPYEYLYLSPPFEERANVGDSQLLQKLLLTNDFDGYLGVRKVAEDRYIVLQGRRVFGAIKVLVEQSGFKARFRRIPCRVLTVDDADFAIQRIYSETVYAPLIHSELQILLRMASERYSAEEISQRTGLLVDRVEEMVGRSRDATTILNGDTKPRDERRVLIARPQIETLIATVPKAFVGYRKKTPSKAMLRALTAIKRYMDRSLACDRTLHIIAESFRDGAVEQEPSVIAVASAEK